MSYEERILTERAQSDRVRPRAASNLLLWGILLFFLLALAWAAWAEIDRAVRGQGRVVASSQLQVVSNLEGGIVEAILVRTGGQVRRGDPLVRLDQTQTGAELGGGEATFGALGVKLARLRAEAAGVTPVFPPARDRATADQIRVERALHASRMAELSSLLRSGEAQIVQAERGVAEAQAALAARQEALSARRTEAATLRPLVAKGIEPRLSLSQAESAAAVAASEAAGASAAVARARSAVAQARADLARARGDWRARAGEEYSATQAELSARRAALPALEERVERTVVRAPLAGRINRVLVTTVGGTVAPGSPIAEIVPSEDSLLVEAMITPQDIASVRSGQRAKVSITAYDPAVYGSLDGQVVSISPDTVQNERTGETFYVVQVRTAKTALTDQRGRPLPIGPGMIANVDLLGDKRTVLDYILSPITRLSETAFRE